MPDVATTRKVQRLHERLAAERLALVSAVRNEGYMAVQLADYLNRMATAEGRVHAAESIIRAVDREAAADIAIGLAVHTDDTWSGRTNDVRRAFTDGVLEVARNWEDYS
jgi:hypothetical protein